MRQLIIFIGLLIFGYSFGQSAKAERLGLIGELVFIKYSSESKALEIISLAKNPLEGIQKYNDVRIMADQIIVQLISDSHKKTNISVFKNLDALLVSNSIQKIEEDNLSDNKIKGYIESLKKLEKINNEFLKLQIAIDSPKGNRGNVKSLSVEQGIAVFDAITKVAKDIKEAREKKVEKIVTILNDLRLKSIQDLSKNEETQIEEVIVSG